MADALPLTRRAASPERADAIRQAVRAVTGLPVVGEGQSRIATLDDAAALAAFLADPAVHAPIYTVPQPINEETMTGFIADHMAQQARGEGLLALSLSPDGALVGYSDIQVWPQWAAGELGGALRADRQSAGQGARGAAASFDWMFETLGLETLCETASLDNVRTARLLDGLGFERMGEIDSVRPDGTIRRSRVWEITRPVWRARHPGPDRSPATAP